MRMRKAGKYILFLTCVFVLCVVGIVGIQILRNPSVPIVFDLPGDRNCCGTTPRAGFLNPFRDGAPEKSAERFLIGIRDRACTDVVRETLLDDERRVRVCEIQSYHHLQEWKLTYRKDRTDGIDELEYWQWFKGGDQPTIMTMEVVKDGDTWKVRSWSASY